MPIDINSVGVHSNSSTRIKGNGTEKQASSVAGEKAVSTPAKEDKVELSSTAKSLQSIEERLRGMPDVNEDKVAAIKAALADGSYQVDSQRLAQKMLAFDAQL
ncbi:flagellar biosynthesis anti-sigma factor FlgM [Balneatrix alpica]|uniref:Negative regulator of flagellin synthesis n=1 Tax=Balneatrix alpica TaxID=75684 RepID=A0ABV5ZHR7_9GAMM|nr:flagellar biosynthesis anti-sigma factor FlgM [Balneatrix alpica]